MPVESCDTDMWKQAVKVALIVESSSLRLDYKVLLVCFSTVAWPIGQELNLYDLEDRINAEWISSLTHLEEVKDATDCWATGF